ncbi:MAG TPA: hypothetical protein VLS93_14245 [Anaeromyxobacteraceae bacterium]|nr:hypothetical protein [Anaeromyxobacteraceae bacterium]
MTPSPPPTVPSLARTLAWNGVASVAVGALARYGLAKQEIGTTFMVVGAVMILVGLAWMAVGAARARRRGGDPGSG